MNYFPLYPFFASYYDLLFRDFGHTGPFDMGAIQHARRNNQRAKAQKRRRS